MGGVAGVCEGIGRIREGVGVVGLWGAGLLIGVRTGARARGRAVGARFRREKRGRECEREC